MPTTNPAHKRIDPVIVENLARLGCTYQEIADICDVSRSTIFKNFSEVVKKGHADLGRQIRAKQFKKAIEDEDTKMLIHMGKYYLKQNDHLTITHETEELQEVSSEELFDILRTSEGEGETKH